MVVRESQTTFVIQLCPGVCQHLRYSVLTNLSFDLMAVIEVVANRIVKRSRIEMSIGLRLVLGNLLKQVAWIAPCSTCFSRFETYQPPIEIGGNL